MKTNFSPLLELAELLPMTTTRLMSLPDIIDLRCGRHALALYLYPIKSWHWQFHIERKSASMNSLTPWMTKYCCEITLPTMHVEYVRV